MPGQNKSKDSRAAELQKELEAAFAENIKAQGREKAKITYDESTRRGTRTKK